MLTIKGRDSKDYVCKSTDSKPASAANGSMLLEMDTGKFYVYDAAGETWIELS